MSRPKLRNFLKGHLIELLDDGTSGQLTTVNDTDGYESQGGRVRYHIFTDREKGRNYRFAYGTWGDDPLAEWDHEVPCVEVGWAVQ